MAIRVFIATTEGPAEVQRITKEDPLVKSVVCLDGKAIRLPIGGNYDDFVRDPTGVIERHYGHGSFRLDLARGITEGYSWQLGVFAAHALFAEDRLARPDDIADMVIWATGEVDRDLAVLPVNHLREKLRRSQDLFDRLRTEGLPLTIFVPTQNMEDFDPAWIGAKNVEDANCRMIPVATIDELCDAIGLSVPKRTRLPEKTTGSQRIPLSVAPGIRIRWRHCLIGLSFVVAAIAAGLWWALPSLEPSTETSAPEQPVLQLSIVAYRVGKGGKCPADGHSGLVADPVISSGPDRFTATSLKGLCALGFRVNNHGDPAYVWGFAQAIPDRTYLMADRQSLLHQQERTRGMSSWIVRPPSNLNRPLTYRFVGLLSDKPLAGPVDRLLRQLFGDRTKPYAPDWAIARQQLEASSVTVVSRWHELVP